MRKKLLQQLVLVLGPPSLFPTYSLCAGRRSSSIGRRNPRSTRHSRGSACSRGASGCRRQELGRQRVDADELGAGADDDRAGTGAVLRRAGSQEECARHDDAELRDDGGDHGAMGDRGLQSGVWAGQQLHRGASTICFLHGVGAQAGCRLCGNDSRADVHGLPVDVRHHHAGADYRGVRGAHEIQRDARCL